MKDLFELIVFIIKECWVYLLALLIVCIISYLIANEIAESNLSDWMKFYLLS